MIRIVALGTALAVAGCSSGGESEPAGSETPRVTASATASAQDSGGARAESEETETYIFAYSYPAAAGRIEKLRQWLDTELIRSKDVLVGESTRGRADAEANGYPYNPHSFSKKWQIVTNLPRWLSLSAQVATYSGGAHGNYTFDTLLWDRDADRVREPLALFASPAALDEALGKTYCDKLNAERAKRRGELPEVGGTGMFDECLKVEEVTVLLGSSNGRTFDRIGLLAAPYQAGPYAEGSYEITLPVTRAVLDAVRPEFKADFTVKG